MKVNTGKPVTAHCGKFRPMYVLFAGNDTVPISVRVVAELCAV